eukprot:4318601-Prymnesium_polylepis.1
MPQYSTLILAAPAVATAASLSLRCDIRRGCEWTVWPHQLWSTARGSGCARTVRRPRATLRGRRSR